MKDGPLDMRMDPTSGIPVSQWLREADLDDITWVIREFGEDTPRSKRTPSTLPAKPYSSAYFAIPENGP
ncbi:16S rRNA (cytosine(1402)-N(4))-methyltransferase [Vibrio astriarenae]